ncbi:hypothetical protein QUB63_12640 [Microcoleus sp. ARI1-B5]|uniref:hypothetical protein n=1 Tax=unclassified Microcoleus TaxID=2642155 RepID=UPI002FD78568
MLYKGHIAVNRAECRDFLCFFSASAVPQFLSSGRSHIDRETFCKISAVKFS